jgi:hypothetical protein
MNIVSGLLPKQLKNALPVKQPTAAPVPKVLAAGFGGTAATLIIIGAKRLLKIDVPPDAAAGIVALAAFGFSYFTKDRNKVGST